MGLGGGDQSVHAFVDIRIFNPFAPSNNTSSLPSYSYVLQLKKLMVNVSEKLNTPFLHVWLCMQQEA